MLRARGLAGRLERTKTSGPGKQLQVLPFFVSDEAWIEHRWLDKGVKLLTKGTFDFGPARSKRVVAFNYATDSGSGRLVVVKSPVGGGWGWGRSGVVAPPQRGPGGS